MQAVVCWPGSRTLWNPRRCSSSADFQPSPVFLYTQTLKAKRALETVFWDPWQEWQPEKGAYIPSTHARHCPRPFRRGNSFHAHENPLRWVLLSSPSYGREESTQSRARGRGCGWDPGRLASQPSSDLWVCTVRTVATPRQLARGKTLTHCGWGEVREKDSRRGRDLRSIVITEGQLGPPTLSWKWGQH